MTRSPDAELQYKRLVRLLNEARDYGAMVYLEQPGDLGILVPIAPELRGFEIIADPRPDRDDNYDIWKRKSGRSPKPVKFNLSRSEVRGWLSEFPVHSDDDFKANGARWVEEVMLFYKVPKRQPRMDS